MSHLGEVPSTARSANVTQLRAAELCLELPSIVTSSAFEIDDLESVLSALSGYCPERELPAGFARKRRAEYLAGRYAAELALARLGIRGRVGRMVNGLPAWPEGAVGSISHGGGIACAIAADATRYRCMGVDVERVLDDAEAHEIGASIANADELLLLRAALPYTRAGQRLSIVFSAKESLFKALFPLTHEFLEFSDVKLVSLGMASRYQGVLTLRLERSISAEFASGAAVRARFFLGPDRVESAVLLRMG